jgi:hypothetical protein
MLIYMVGTHEKLCRKLTASIKAGEL